MCALYAGLLFCQSLLTAAECNLAIINTLSEHPLACMHARHTCTPHTSRRRVKNSGYHVTNTLCWQLLWQLTVISLARWATLAALLLLLLNCLSYSFWHPSNVSWHALLIYTLQSMWSRHNVPLARQQCLSWELSPLSKDYNHYTDGNPWKVAVSIIHCVWKKETKIFFS